MFMDNGKTFRWLTILVAFFASFAAFGGLFVDGTYRDNDLVVAAWQGNDIITLFLVVPMMLVSLLYVMKGSDKAQLFWLGSLWYMVYNYMFYTFGAAFNYFFLVYVGLFTISAYTLIFALLKTDANKLSRYYGSDIPVKWISGFMWFFAVLLGGMWTALALSFLFTGEVHPTITQTGHPTAVVFAVDLSLLVPSLILSSSLLWRQHPWGYVLSAIVLIKATAYGLALLAMTVVSAMKTGTTDPFIFLWVFLTAGCVAALVSLLRNRKKDKQINTGFNQTG